MAVERTRLMQDLLANRHAATEHKPLRDQLRRGLPYATLERIEDHFHLDPSQVASVLSLPERTRARRKHQRVLSAVESDRLYRLARIASIASDVLGDREKAGRWLQKPNRALGGETPIDLLDTELGARQV